MKKSHLVLFVLVILLGTAITIVSCKKEKNNSDNGCPIAGGLQSLVRILFWVSKDYGGGTYNVQVTDDKGKVVYAYYHQIAIYDFSEPDACNSSDANYSKHAYYDLNYGHTYTYTAISDNRSFKGTITTPCAGAADSYACKSIQVDH